MKTTLFTAVVVLVVAGGACADDKLPETPYFPLKTGDAWHYKMGDSKFTITVATFEDVDKQPCARLETSVGVKVIAIDQVAVKADGVYRYTTTTEGNKIEKIEPPLCFLKLPVKKDEAWKVASAVGSAGKVSGTFKTGELVELKVGETKYEQLVTVTCDELDAAGMKAKVTYYFAKGVGMVKQTIAVAGQEVVIELEKYEPAK